MKSCIKNKLLLVICVLAVVSLFSGCSEKPSQATTPKSTAEDKSKQESTPTNSPANSKTDTVEKQYKTYENTQYGIKVDYLQDWTVAEGVQGSLVTFLSPAAGTSDAFRENINVLVQDLSAQPMTLEAYTELSVQQIHSLFGDSSVESSEKATLSDKEAQRIVYTGKLGQLDLKWKQIWTVKDNKAYIITYTAAVTDFENYVNEFDKITDSLKVE